MHTVVAGILIAEGRALLTLRSAKRRAHPGTWALPGGHVEPGEPEVEALHRELREELGIDALDCGDEPASRLHLTDGPPSAQLHLSAWRVRTWKGQPSDRLAGEHERIAWFGAGGLDGLAWAHPEHRQVLQDMLSRPGH
ncbi:NUDIX domain-containing protein [Kineococcus sp. SYSU DK018]|uniref:NUDIX domain-containing protein n=1 Tax=Kineococcus sp. SYSU DK018 TaxID=3383139 RepID=UPI003D7DBAC7